MFEIQDDRHEQFCYIGCNSFFMQDPCINFTNVKYQPSGDIKVFCCENGKKPIFGIFSKILCLQELLLTVEVGLVCFEQIYDRPLNIKRVTILKVCHIELKIHEPIVISPQNRPFLEAKIPPGCRSSIFVILDFFLSNKNGGNCISIQSLKLKINIFIL